VGFRASPSLAALGGAFGSSAISVDGYRKAPFYGWQEQEFLHIADKRVNREDSGIEATPCAQPRARLLASRRQSIM
jgi:hypothetical protein